ncbi:hypothetical protein NLI96_g4543 [Meripilus lineatus]|uniref:Uncharacterized protein n=1 Tax=Meripilus lineatus TaxID=2056292 RepID=A0AAD5V6X2_9APHY|nr:hypothetical protein NLI96_g4543 [Physisporinus lineatus]
MPSFLAIVALGLAALSPIANAGTLTSRQQLTELSPYDTQLLSARSPESFSLPVPRTNAERLRRGLGPAPPKRRNHLSRLQARESPTPCTPTPGVISVQITGGQAGFLSKTLDTSGKYKFTTVEADALQVAASCSNPRTLTTLVCTFHPSGMYPKLQMLTVCLIPSSQNGSPTFPDLGLVEGVQNSITNSGPAIPSRDLAAGSFHYVFVGATVHTEPGAIGLPGANSISTAIQNNNLAVESSVWTLGDNGVVTPAWVNSDGTVAAQAILYISSTSTFTVVGDAQQYGNLFGVKPLATWTFLQGN